jgi:hypothetical protein
MMFRWDSTYPNIFNSCSNESIFDVFTFWSKIIKTKQSIIWMRRLYIFLYINSITNMGHEHKKNRENLIDWLFYLDTIYTVHNNKNKEKRNWNIYINDSV